MDGECYARVGGSCHIVVSVKSSRCYGCVRRLCESKLWWSSGGSHHNPHLIIASSLLSRVVRSTVIGTQARGSNIWLQIHIALTYVRCEMAGIQAQI